MMGKEMKQILKPELVLIGEVEGPRGRLCAGAYPTSIWL